VAADHTAADRRQWQGLTSRQVISNHVVAAAEMADHQRMRNQLP
jgi:hypothetical protein